MRLTLLLLRLATSAWARPGWIATPNGWRPASVVFTTVIGGRGFDGLGAASANSASKIPIRMAGTDRRAVRRCCSKYTFPGIIFTFWLADSAASRVFITNSGRQLHSTALV